MKKIFVAVLLASLVGKVFCQTAVIIKQKAKAVANQNSAQQGLPPQYPASQPPAQPAARTAPAPTQLTPEQQAFTRVVADLAAVKTNDISKVSADLMAMARGASKPSSAMVQRLAKDLVTALVGKTLTPAQRPRMAQDIQAVLSGANVPATQMDAIIADVAAILKTAGADATAIAIVRNDLKAVLAEFLRPGA